jgi:hypothetical protein
LRSEEMCMNAILCPETASKKGGGVSLKRRSTIRTMERVSGSLPLVEKAPAGNLGVQFSGRPRKD